MCHLRTVAGVPLTYCGWCATYVLWLVCHLRTVTGVPLTYCDWCATYVLWLVCHLRTVAGVPLTYCGWCATYVLWLVCHLRTVTGVPLTYCGWCATYVLWLVCHLRTVAGVPLTYCGWCATYVLWLVCHLRTVAGVPLTYCGWCATYVLWLVCHLRTVAGVPLTYCGWCATYILWFVCHLHRLGPANTRLLAAYMNFDPRMAVLVPCVRLWARGWGIKRSILNNYSLSLMLIHTLQHASPPVLPCLQVSLPLLTSIACYCCILQDPGAWPKNMAWISSQGFSVPSEQHVQLDGWDCSFSDPRSLLPSSNTVSPSM